MADFSPDAIRDLLSRQAQREGDAQAAAVKVDQDLKMDNWVLNGSPSESKPAPKALSIFNPERFASLYDGADPGPATRASFDTILYQGGPDVVPVATHAKHKPNHFDPRTWV